MARGTIAHVVPERGFGFITPDEAGPDLFFHARDVVGVPFAQVRPGQRVEFTHGTDPRHPRRTQAVRIQPVED